MAIRYDTTLYETDAGNKFKIRLSTQSAAITGNTAPAGPDTDPNVEVKVSQAGNRRKFGLAPRGVRYKRTTGTGDATKAYYTFVPSLTPAARTAMFAANEATFGGFTWKPYSLVNEE